MGPLAPGQLHLLAASYLDDRSAPEEHGWEGSDLNADPVHDKDQEREWGRG
jgi:hypothetical protein